MKPVKSILVLCLVSCVVAMGCSKGAGRRAVDEDCDDTASSASITASSVELFDAHGHLMPTWRNNELNRAAAAAEVTGMVLLGVGDVLSYQRQDPDMFTACAWVDPADEDLAALKEDLDAGAKCIGETSLRHFASGPSATATINDASSSFMKQVYAEAARRGVPINIHFDYSLEHIAEWETALSEHRDTSFVWAHSGDAPASVVEALLEAHPNLHADISSRNPLCDYSGRLVSIEEQRLDNGDLSIKEDWRTLFEEHSDRILFGTDIGPGARHTVVANTVAYYRTILGQLSQQAQERIGYQNGKALFGVR